MRNLNHKEPCRTLQDAVKLLAEVITNEYRTRSWCDALSKDLKKTNDSIVSLERSISEKLSNFNATLAARTSVIGGGVCGFVVGLIELIRWLING
jgi:hypothetical protein